jgi:hypothetical protein
MMGTLATVLAGKKIFTTEDRYRAEAEGDIENVEGVLRVTTIRVTYHLKVPKGLIGAAGEAFSSYLHLCPAAQSVIGCISIRDELMTEEIE